MIGFSAGRFEWTVVGKACVPCLLKSDGTKYVSVRIAESKVLGHFFQRLNAEVFNCVSVKSFSITEAETKLLNEINSRHCEFAFGKNPFNMDSDFIVQLDELVEFYNFINTCYNKLLHTPLNGTNKCGFVRINDDSVVPYAIRDSKQYVPLFYFEGETESLKLKAINLENWDLAYLKFCCKVQGIKNELFASEQCMVTSLEDVKSYFPEGTKFEEYWPTKLLDMQIPAKNDMHSNHSWVQTPHIEHAPATAAAAPPTAIVAPIPQPQQQQTVVPISSHVAAGGALIGKNVPVLQKPIHGTHQRIHATTVNTVISNVPQIYQTSNAWQNPNVTQAGTYHVASHQITPAGTVVQPRMAQKQATNALHSVSTRIARALSFFA